MKKMWISALLAAAMMTAAGAADAPSAWAQKSVDAARAAGLVPSQVDSAFDTPITREDFCSLAAAVYRAWDRENVLQTASTGKVSFTERDLRKAAVKLTKALLNRDSSFVTVIYGQDITQEQAQEVEAAIREKLPDGVDMALVNGGQPVYYLIISVE